MSVNLKKKRERDEDKDAISGQVGLGNSPFSCKLPVGGILIHGI